MSISPRYPKVIGWTWLALASAIALPATAQKETPASWFLLVTDEGEVVGHRWQRVIERPDEREIVSAQEVVQQEPDDPVTRTVTETTVRQDKAGRTLSIEDYSRTGRAWSRTTARFLPGRAVITRSTRMARRTITVPLPDGVRFDSGNGLLRDWDPATVPRLSFDNFSLDAMAVERVTIERAPQAGPGPAAGVAVLRKRWDGDALRSVARMTMGGDGRILSVTQPMLGTAVTLVPTDRESARRPHPPFRAIASLGIKSPFRIDPDASRGHVRYRFTFRDGIAFAPPATGEQRVLEAPGEVTLDICAACGPGLPNDSAALADARRATAWLQSDHARIVATARPIARLRVPDARKMELLTARTAEVLPRVDFAGHYSALEAIERGAGDCGESAVLLAALGRAAGIPTRVANGLVYSRARYHGLSNAFMPHSWVLAWVDGRWKSYDAALGAFDSTHVALTIGDGDPRSASASNQLGSLLIWQAMAEVRSR